MFRPACSLAMFVAICGCGDAQPRSASTDSGRSQLNVYPEVQLNDGTFLRLFRVDPMNSDAPKTTLIVKRFIELDHVKYEPLDKDQQPLRALSYSFAPDSTTNASWVEFPQPKEDGELTLFVFHYKADIDTELVGEPMHFKVQSESETYVVAPPPPREFTRLFFDPMTSRYSEIKPQRQTADDAESTVDTTGEAG